MQVEWKNVHAAREALENGCKLAGKLQSAIDNAFATLPDDLKKFVGDDRKGVSIVARSKNAHSWHPKGVIAIRVDHRNDYRYGDTTLHVLKNGDVNRDRLNNLVRGMIEKRVAETRVASVREKNLKVWEAAGSPGGKRVEMMSAPEKYKVVYIGSHVSSGSFGHVVTIDKIEPLIAVFEAAEENLKNAVSEALSDA